MIACWNVPVSLQEAAVAGADYCIVIAPGYFNFAIGKDRQALRAFFIEVCDKSPIPVMIYNFPVSYVAVTAQAELSIHPIGRRSWN